MSYLEINSTLLKQLKYSEIMVVGPILHIVLWVLMYWASRCLLSNSDGFHRSFELIYVGKNTVYYKDR